MADSTLAAIQTKVRRLTRSPSESQLSTAELNQYINTFVLYDFPQHVRLFDSLTTLTFFTEPYIDTYDTNTTDIDNPLYNFKNKYVSVHPPVYIAGYNQLYTQSREQFYAIYPRINSISSIGVGGDGVTTDFTGNIGNGTILQNNVLFSAIDSNNNSLELHDIPYSATFGILEGSVGAGANWINYVTGEFSISFSAAPAAGSTINSQTVPYVASLPQALLFFDNKFIMRPVPDQAYRVELQVYVVPTELLETTQSPDIQQWWQYIAYGAAKKIFEDRMDNECLQIIMPEFKKQECLVLRKTLVQNSNERTSTIYTEQTSGSLAGGWGWGTGLL